MTEYVIKSYDERVQMVVDKVIVSHASTPFTSKNSILEGIHAMSKELRISDYTIGGSAQRAFLKDVTAQLKGKVKVIK